MAEPFHSSHPQQRTRPRTNTSTERINHQLPRWSQDNTTRTESLVMNLSQYNLSPEEEALLEKGLSFVPTAEHDPFQTRIEIAQLIRKIRLKQYFGQMTPSEEKKATTLRGKSTFYPPPNAITPESITFEKALLKKLEELEREIMPGFKNFSKKNRQALQSLSNNVAITIKPADKGGATVIMDTTAYHHMVMELLQDHVSYRQLGTDPTEAIRQLIVPILEEAHAEELISTKEYEFLNPKYPKKPAFYALPKVHKGRNPPPGRPIVSGIGSILEPLSQFVDYFLKPEVTKMRSYLKDTTAVLELIKDRPFDPTLNILVTLDIESLYTKIPQMATLRVIDKILRERDPPMTTPVSLVMQLAEIALTKNFFIYENSFYEQISGTAMGATFAPSLANLYVANFEEAIIYNPTNPWLPNLDLWARYIDDVLLIFKGTELELATFMIWLNGQNPFLKLSETHSTESVHFLDLTLEIRNATIFSTVFNKPTDRNSLLTYGSFHPTSLRRNLPFGQFLRYRRNCSTRTDYIRQSASLAAKLRNRGYPKRIIKQARKRASNIPREVTLEHHVKSNEVENTITAVMSFSPIANKIKKEIVKLWPILNVGQHSIDTPRFALKRRKNLRDALVHSYREKEHRLNTLWGQNPATGHTPCGTCNACSSTKRTTSINIGWHYPWIQKTLTNCNSSNVIYMITCPCDKRYIGMTTRPIKIRLAEHRSCIRTKKITAPMVEHFLAAKHTSADFTWTIIEKVSIPTRGGNLQNLLFKREQLWIFRLKTDKDGLNEATSWQTLATL
ncbi:uncharacterized protein [Ambystoma mexicanum]|uniref:uncharacterized protein n=1 Tax=Ambystoma mexicanum TaxID=8296 RepID=UPI0037E81CDE